MGTYFSAVEGDPLSSAPDSYVMSSGSNTFFDEDGHRSMAFVGGDAYCGKCKSIGKIIGGSGCSDSARAYDVPTGRRQAVAGDFVQCQCSMRPVILVRYGTGWVINDTWGSHAQALGSSTQWSQEGRASDFDELIVLHDEQGNPVAGLRYKLTTDDGQVFQGVTDERGATQRVYSDRQVGIVVELAG
jgi:hypothetical protein